MPFAYGPGDQQVHYRTFGHEGTPVVLLQGLGLSGHFWFDVPRQLSRRGVDPYRVVVPDNRGTGDSPVPRRPFTIASMADDVRAVLDAQKIDRAIIVGNSMGGMIAQQFALRHADRTAGLVLMSTSPGLPVGRLPRPAVMQLLLGSAFKQPRDMTPLGRLLLPESQMDRMHELLHRWPEVLRKSPTPPKTFALHLGAVATHAAAPRLHKIQCPTHVLAGREDVLLPPKNAEILARRIPDATLEVLPGVAHSILTLEPTALERALERVSERIDSYASPPWGGRGRRGSA